MYCVCVCPELHADEWGRRRPEEGGEEASASRCRDPPGGEDDSDTDLTYGEVEQRLDLLQQHLSRCDAHTHTHTHTQTHTHISFLFFF